MKTRTAMTRLAVALVAVAAMWVPVTPADAYSGSGAMHVHPIEDGHVGTAVEDRNWSAGWTHIEAFQDLAGKNYVLVYNKTTARTLVYPVGTDGKLGPRLIDTTTTTARVSMAVVTLTNGIFLIATEQSQPGVAPWAHIYRIDLAARTIAKKRTMRADWDSIAATHSLGGKAYLFSVGSTGPNLLAATITAAGDLFTVTHVETQPIEPGATHVDTMIWHGRLVVIVYKAATGNATYRYAEFGTGELYNSSPPTNIGKGWTIMEPYSNAFDVWLFLGNATTGAARVERLGYTGSAHTPDLFTRWVTWARTWTTGWTVGETIPADSGFHPKLMIVKTA